MGNTMNVKKPARKLTSALHRMATMFCGVLIALVTYSLAWAQDDNWPPETSAPYSAKAIHGKVVDAESGEPLAGVIIVADWMIDRKWVGDEKALLKIMETVSDASGNYEFPAWGPIMLPPLADFRGGKDPEVSYFKVGYWPEFESNNVSTDIKLRNRNAPLGDFKGNGQTIKLKKWDGKDERAYHSALSFLGSSMPSPTRTEWRKYPRLALALDSIATEVRARPNLPWNWPVPRVPGFRSESLSNEDREYLKGYRE